MGRTHALLSASDAARWIACPPSVRLTEHIPDRSNKNADEGTLAHSIAELYLRADLGLLDPVEAHMKIGMLKNDSLFAPDMLDYVEEYADLVVERYNTALAKTKDAQILVEAKLDYSEWVTAGFGTGDAVIIADGTMEIIDLKYGKGTPVSAIGNPQLRLYAAGALAEFGYLYGVDKIKTTIFQPRLDSVTSEELTVGELQEWLDTVVVPAAKLAYAGEGEYNPGKKQCQWCKVKAGCKARKDAHMELLAYGFKDAKLMTLDEIGSVLTVSASLAKWAKDVEEFVTDKLKNGESVPGWKLVEGRSNRTITNEEKAAEILIAAADGDEAKVYKARALRGITDLEKQFGKKQLSAMIGSVIEKPKGKPVLANESDPMSDINGVENDFKNEDFEI